MIVEGESAVYHVMSRTALDGYVLGDIEKDYLLQLIKHLSSIYFAEILGFSIMGNHFHVIVRMKAGEEYSDAEIRRRVEMYFQHTKIKRVVSPKQIPTWREKLGHLSEFMKDIKQSFTRYYNKRHNRRGFFWGGRYKSVLLEEGNSLVNCLAYVDLNSVRAGIVGSPDDYRWSSLGYHCQTGNKDKFLSVDYGDLGADNLSEAHRLKMYRQFVYEVGALPTPHGKSIGPKKIEKETKRGFEKSSINRFLGRIRYFTDSGIIGSKEFISNLWQKLRAPEDNPDKVPVRITGLENVYSLKRLGLAKG